MMKKMRLDCALSLIATFTNAATFEWSFGIYNSQSGIAPVNVTAYLYAIDLDYPTLDLREIRAVPELSTVLLALAGLSALCLHRRKVS